jgi:hypothetical protein
MASSCLFRRAIPAIVSSGVHSLLIIKVGVFRFLTEKTRELNMSFVFGLLEA